jgi:hypothetical protein
VHAIPKTEVARAVVPKNWINFLLEDFVDFIDLKEYS